MKTSLIKIIILFNGLVLYMSSCKKEEMAVSPPVPGNEFITTVKIRFQNSGNANDTTWAIWKDISAGANAPDTSKAIINLKKNSTYKASVYFFDETKTPAIDLTPEVRERANYHSYWFFKSGAIANNLTIVATDYDTNNPPLVLGLLADFTTTATIGTGRLEGVLKHQPNGKDGTFAPGSTDSDVFFTLTITN